MVREKHADVKTPSKCNRKNPNNTNALKLKKAQIDKLTNKQNTHRIRSIKLDTWLKMDNLG